MVLVELWGAKWITATMFVRSMYRIVTVLNMRITNISRVVVNISILSRFCFIPSEKGGSGPLGPPLPLSNILTFHDSIHLAKVHNKYKVLME